ncbi:MAG: class I SAM-dependent methyltransferase [Hyphomicrobiaceae bacterium]|nr:class I SAM-dependent methyltransferase [Hyphomicrobiaceae bacterium]
MRHSNDGRPSPWVMRYVGGLRPGGCVLDVACGSGRHLRAILDAGHSAVGIDRDVCSARALQATGRLELIEADLEAGSPFPTMGRTFDGVIVTNYLWRAILPDIVESVGETGILIYETFAVGHERFGRPSNPDFLLRPGDLLGAVCGRLVTLAYQHGQLSEPERIVQRIVAVGPEHEWLTVPPLL